MFNAKRQDSFTPGKFLQLLLIALQVNLENAFCKICKLTQCVGKTTVFPQWNYIFFLREHFRFYALNFHEVFQPFLVIVELVFL